jgi:hypothetical protein
MEQIYGPERLRWMRMTPQERWTASMKLWEEYVANGGSLDPEPDPQSPFYFPEDYDSAPSPAEPNPGEDPESE